MIEIEELLTSFQESLGMSLPGLLGAILILLVGWLVALVLRGVVRRLLGALETNRRLSPAEGQAMDLERGVSQGVYVLLMLMVFLAFFNALGLELASEPLRALLDSVMAYLPRVAGAGLLLLVAWLIATVLRRLAQAGLQATGLDHRAGAREGEATVSTGLATALYWLIFLLFLPGILGALELGGLLTPVQEMTAQLLGALPDLLGAVVIGLVGWFVARLLREIVTNLLAAAGFDRLADRVGLSGATSLSGVAGLVVYILVLVPSLVAALDAAGLGAVARPATGMLERLLAAVPQILSAALILGIAWTIGRLATGLLRSLLVGVGFDRLPAALGLSSVSEDADAAPSRFAAQVAFFFIMLFAVVEAAGQLGLSTVEELVEVLLEFGGQVLLGAAIIAGGWWLARLAHRAVVAGGGSGASLMASLARMSILGLVLAMGLRAMGLADEIVDLAFGLTLGAVAVAFALAFGLGGREPARQLLARLVERMPGPDPKVLAPKG